MKSNPYVPLETIPLYHFFFNLFLDLEGFGFQTSYQLPSLFFIALQQGLQVGDVLFRIAGTIIHTGKNQKVEDRFGICIEDGEEFLRRAEQDGRWQLICRFESIAAEDSQVRHGSGYGDAPQSKSRYVLYNEYG